MSGGPEVRQQLAEALHGALCSCPEVDAGTGFYFRTADEDKALTALLPVVDRIAAQRATEALQAAARSPVRQAAAVLSDGELGDALDLWYEQRARAEAMVTGRQENR